MKSVFIMLCAALCSYAAIAQNSATIPEPAKAAFSKSYTGATKVKWEKEDGDYEVSFTYQNNKMSVLYTAAGIAAETETEMAITMLPQPALKYASAKGFVKGAAKIIKADGSILYEAELKGKDLLFNEKGDFITEKKD